MRRQLLTYPLNVHLFLAACSLVQQQHRSNALFIYKLIADNGLSPPPQLLEQQEQQQQQLAGDDYYDDGDDGVLEKLLLLPQRRSPMRLRFAAPLSSTSFGYVLAENADDAKAEEESGDGGLLGGDTMQRPLFQSLDDNTNRLIYTIDQQQQQPRLDSSRSAPATTAFYIVDDSVASPPPTNRLVMPFLNYESVADELEEPLPPFDNEPLTRRRRSAIAVIADPDRVEADAVRRLLNDVRQNDYDDNDNDNDVGDDVEGRLYNRDEPPLLIVDAVPDERLSSGLSTAEGEADDGDSIDEEDEREVENLLTDRLEYLDRANKLRNLLLPSTVLVVPVDKDRR